MATTLRLISPAPATFPAPGVAASLQRLAVAAAGDLARGRWGETPPSAPSRDGSASAVAGSLYGRTSSDLGPIALTARGVAEDCASSVAPDGRGVLSQ
jgi:hypothetical protein